ncbi:exonuclease VII small subunit [Xanthomonas sp. JAI131]|uniref:hypothetical protein n=1 Tax=Xanthomonas sp. JAI131 TaxID=2723067 RepID=UPI0015CE6C92|nr:hypothetical protein [Xanthomonas sp. JAI131]NYF22846.1 exonuclease VII small subunit [Xanthomonas sp. JAI131]
MKTEESSYETLVDLVHDLQAVQDDALELLDKATAINNESIRRNNLDADEYEELPLGEETAMLRSNVLNPMPEEIACVEKAIKALEAGAISEEQAAAIAVDAAETLKTAEATLEEVEQSISRHEDDGEDEE